MRYPLRQPRLPPSLLRQRILPTSAASHLIASVDQVSWAFRYQAQGPCAPGVCHGTRGDQCRGAGGLVRCLSYPVHEHLLSGQLLRVLPGYEPPAMLSTYREGRNAPMRVRCCRPLRGSPARTPGISVGVRIAGGGHSLGARRGAAWGCPNLR